MTAVEPILPELEPIPGWPAGLPQHLSASSLSQLERCAEQFRRRVILGEKERPSGSLLWGRADGQAHALNFTDKIVSHEDWPVEDVQLAFATLLDEEVANVEEEIDWRDDTHASVKDRGVELVAAYHRHASPKIQPTAVEERFEITVPGVAVPVIGFIDVSTEPTSIERKTSSAKSSSVPPQYVLQTLLYALARRKPVELHIATRTKVPAVYTPAEEPGLWTGFDERLALRAERSIASRARLLLALWEEFGENEPWPDAIGTQSWHMATCDLCGFRPTCPWWK